MQEIDWPRVGVVGPGAVGCYFGGMLARAGAAVTCFGRPGSKSPHLEALRKQGIGIDGVTVKEKIPVEVAELGPALAGHGLILFCVKSQDTAAAARAIAPHLEEDARVVSLQNGVDNVERLAEAGIRALPSVVFVAAAIEEPGVVRHRGRGDLVLGPPLHGSPPPGRDDEADARHVASLFEAAGVPCPVAEDIRRHQWLKLAINSMANGISALTQASYRRLAEFEPTWAVARRVGEEAVAVAAADGVELDLEEIEKICQGIVTSIGEATASTAQDIAAGRPTEIDSLNGYIARRGAALGVPTPVNETLYALVKLLEEKTTSAR